jgi:hypothetical protein
MLAYEVYQRNSSGDDRLIYVLPERRKDPARITHESVKKWIRSILNNMSEEDFKEKVYFIPVI